MLEVLTPFRRQFLRDLLGFSVLAFVLVLIANRGTGEVRTAAAALLAALYAACMVILGTSLFVVPRVRRWALQPSASLGGAAVWVGAAILSALVVGIASFARFLQLL